MRDQLVVMRERLFQLTAATAARTKKVDGLLLDCAAAGRVFRARIGLPDWNNVLAMPGHQFAYSLDEELKEEMERVSKNFDWKSASNLLNRSAMDPPRSPRGAVHPFVNACRASHIAHMVRKSNNSARMMVMKGWRDVLPKVRKAGGRWRSAIGFGPIFDAQMWENV